MWYLFYSKQTTQFVYPKGDSPLIYIGKADNLRRRIQDHLVAYKNANPKATRQRVQGAKYCVPTVIARI
ncbi:MAG: GIY-YIG nuclease family protein [Bacteroides sp.]